MVMMFDTVIGGVDRNPKPRNLSALFSAESLSLGYIGWVGGVYVKQFYCADKCETV